MMHFLRDTMNRKQLRSGMTLIEIMIVVSIIVLMMTLGAVNMGILGVADVSSDALRFSSTIRYVFNLAATSNTTLQMKIDFENNTFKVDKIDVEGGLSAEALAGGQTVRSLSSKLRDDSDRKRRATIDGEDRKFVVLDRIELDKQKEMGEEEPADEEGLVGQAPESREELGGVFLGEEDAGLKEGVYFLGVMTSHHSEEQVDGIATINFFSNGFVERSVVVLGDEKAKSGEEGGVIYTVIINPLSGQSSITRGRIDLNEKFFEPEEDR